MKLHTDLNHRVTVRKYITLAQLADNTLDGDPNGAANVCATLNTLNLNDILFLVQEEDDADCVWDGDYQIINDCLYYVGMTAVGGQGRPIMRQVTADSLFFWNLP